MALGQAPTNKFWTDEKYQALLQLRNQNKTFGECADELNKIYLCKKFTKNSCISIYNRMTKPKSIIMQVITNEN